MAVGGTAHAAAMRDLDLEDRADGDRQELGACRTWPTVAAPVPAATPAGHHDQPEVGDEQVVAEVFGVALLRHELGIGLRGGYVRHAAVDRDELLVAEAPQHPEPITARAVAI